MITVKVHKSTECEADYSAYLSFPYNPTIIDGIKSLADRYWHKKSKEWEVPLESLSEILQMFPREDFDISGEYVDLTPREEVTEINYDFKTVPYEHQKVSFLYGMNKDKWFLGDEQGLGKTKQVIDIACALKEQRGYKHCLIICGVNGLKWNWKNEIALHSNESGHILGEKHKRDGRLTIGSNKDKLKDLECLDALDDYFIITNVESLRDSAILEALTLLVSSRDIPMIAIDEIHKCKSATSQQGKAILKLKPEYRIAMTGTPLMNSPLDLYIILRWLGIEKHSNFQFKKYYAVMGGYGGYEVIGYRHLDELESQLQSIMVRRLKEEVLDLPEKTYIDEYVDMLPKQNVIYKEVKADIRMNIDKISISPNPLAQMIRLRQATGYTGILSDTVQCSAKLDRMEELIEESRENGRQVIVFSNWASIIDEVYARLEQKYPLSMITGETPDDVRQTNVEEFQNGHSKVIIGTTGAMGTGITLHSGTVIIFLDHPWSRALYDQAVDRAHRIGQKQNITIYNLMCKDTIDERIWELVNKKGRMSDALVDGKIIGNKQELIEYLLD